MTPEQTYSGDVTLSGDEQYPVAIEDPENVYVQPGAVDGDLLVRNAEYVYTGVEAGGEAAVDDPETTLRGSLEDAYVEPGAADGDVLIDDAEDVFVAHGGVAGDVQVVGDERRWHDGDGAAPAFAGAGEFGPATGYETVTGWQRSTTLEDPDGVVVSGASNTVSVDGVDGTVEAYLLGWNNELRVDGPAAASVEVHVVGSENAVAAGAYADVTVATECGIDNDVSQDAVPVSDLIQTSESEAYREAFIGRKKVTYQEPAPGEDHCPNCGRDADAVVQRHAEDAFFLFGYPIYQFDAGSTSYECEGCSTHAGPAVELSESERRDLLE